jgi:GNAT superfamily N-acetyltransferase
LRNPAVDPAMIRASFVHPNQARRGIGRRLLELPEAAAGFQRIEIVATLPGVPLYASFHYETVERFNIALSNGENLPVERMRKRPTHSPTAPAS